MNVVKEKLYNLTEQYFGNSANFLLDKIIKKLEIKDISNMNKEQKEDLKDMLIEDLFSSLLSPQKILMIRSQIEDILEG